MMPTYCGRLKKMVPPIHLFPKPWNLRILTLYPYVAKEVIKDLERKPLAWIIWETLKTLTRALIRKR